MELCFTGYSCQKSEIWIVLIYEGSDKMYDKFFVHFFLSKQYWDWWGFRSLCYGAVAFIAVKPKSSCLFNHLYFPFWLDLYVSLSTKFLISFQHLWSFLFSFTIVSRPTALQDRTRDSDDDDLHDRDYDVAALANNLSQAFRYKIYGNEDAEEVIS